MTKDIEGFVHWYLMRGQNQICALNNKTKKLKIKLKFSINKRQEIRIIIIRNY